MGRRNDLEASLRQSYQIVTEYEAIERDSDRPEERQRAERMRERQWQLIERQLAEYQALCRRLGVPPAVDLVELAAGREADPPAGASPPDPAPAGAAAARAVSGPGPLSLFFSYSHRDEKLRDQLADHLKALERQGLIAGWHDRRIAAGEEWAGAIDRHLDSADLILLLVSPAFVASRYCYDVEVKRALERHAAGEAGVIPVILKPVDWHTLPFGRLQALPKDGKPVTRWANRDQAFLDVAQEIRRVAEHRGGTVR